MYTFNNLSNKLSNLKSFRQFSINEEMESIDDDETERLKDEHDETENLY